MYFIYSEAPVVLSMKPANVPYKEVFLTKVFAFFLASDDSALVVVVYLLQLWSTVMETWRLGGHAIFFPFMAQCCEACWNFWCWYVNTITSVHVQAAFKHVSVGTDSETAI